MEMSHWDSRIKALMEQVGMPDSQSLYVAFMQLRNEMAQAALAAAAQAPGSDREIIGEMARALALIDGALDIDPEDSGGVDITLDAIEELKAKALAAAAPVAAPDGWKLVPIEPTPEMQAAWDKAPFDEDIDEEFRSAYRAMIEAAPAQAETVAAAAAKIVAVSATDEKDWYRLELSNGAKIRALYEYGQPRIGEYLASNIFHAD